MKIDQRDADAALGGGEVHSHSSWMLPFALFVIAALIGGGVLIYLAGPTVEDLSGNTPSPTASTDTADIRIDGVSFRIPANYTRFGRGRSSGDQDKVEMYALLPNMSPWSPGDREKFASNAPDSQVVFFTLAVDRGRFTYEENFDRAIKPAAANPEGSPGPFGLTEFKFTGGGYQNTTWYTAPLDDGQFVARCDPSANLAFGASCMRGTRLPGNVGLTYQFKQAHLSQWKQIDAAVRGLVASFRVK